MNRETKGPIHVLDVHEETRASYTGRAIGAIRAGAGYLTRRIRTGE